MGQDLDDGVHLLSNGEGIRLKVEICDVGYEVCGFQITNGSEVIVSNGSGEWFSVNMNGVEEDYDGPDGWYQIDTKDGGYYELERNEGRKFSLTGDRNIELILEY